MQPHRPRRPTHPDADAKKPLIECKICNWHVYNTYNLHKFHFRWNMSTKSYVFILFLIQFSENNIISYTQVFLELTFL